MLAHGRSTRPCTQVHLRLAPQCMRNTPVAAAVRSPAWHKELKECRQLRHRPRLMKCHKEPHEADWQTCNRGRHTAKCSLPLRRSGWHRASTEKAQQTVLRWLPCDSLGAGAEEAIANAVICAAIMGRRPDLDWACHRCIRGGAMRWRQAWRLSRA